MRLRFGHGQQEDERVLRYCSGASSCDDEAGLAHLLRLGRREGLTLRPGPRRHGRSRRGPTALPPIAPISAIVLIVCNAEIMKCAEQYWPTKWFTDRLSGGSGIHGACSIQAASRPSSIAAATAPWMARDNGQRAVKSSPVKACERRDGPAILFIRRHDGHWWRLQSIHFVVMFNLFHSRLL